MDLFRDLRDIPKNAAVRRVNEMVKRARTCKVHYRIRCRMLYLSHTLPHAIPIAYAAACYTYRIRCRMLSHSPRQRDGPTRAHLQGVHVREP
jgi:hypothetical protein